MKPYFDTLSNRRIARRQYQKKYTLKRWGSIEAFRKWKHEMDQKRAEKLLDYKQAKGCKECGESRPWMLDCHHRDPATKTGNVASMARQYSWDRVLKELEKCDILCRNCHADLHWREKLAL